MASSTPPAGCFPGIATLAACWQGDLQPLKAFDGETLDGEAELSLDVFDGEQVVFRYEGIGAAFSFRSSGSADAMGVGLDGVRYVIVDNMRDLVDINSAGDDIRCHQDVESAVAKALHRPVTGTLGHVSLDRYGVQPGVFELSRQPVGPVLGAGEDDRGKAGGELEQVLKQCELSRLLNGIERVLDGLGRLGMGQLGDQGVDQDLVRQLAEIFRHRRGEQQVLAFVREPGNDSSDVREKSHVEHMIRFIQDQRVDFFDIHLAALEEVKETPGATDDNLRSFSERLNLGTLRDSSVDGDGPDSGSSCKGPDLLVDLYCQLPCRSEDEGPWSGSGFFQQALEKRESEGGCFTGSGLCETQDIAARYYSGYSFRLDRAGFVVSGFTECVQEGRLEVKYTETSRIYIGWRIHLLSFVEPVVARRSFFREPGQLRRAATTVEGKEKSEKLRRDPETRSCCAP